MNRCDAAASIIQYMEWEWEVKDCEIFINKRGFDEVTISVRPTAFLLSTEVDVYSQSDRSDHFSFLSCVRTLRTHFS